MDKVKMIKELSRDEGIVEYAYKDSLGYWTIGVGRLIDKRKKGRLRDCEIDFLLSNDIDEKAEELDKAIPWWRDLNEPRQRVLLNMAFNLGTNGLLGFKNTLRMVKAGEYDQAAKNMLKSKWADQVGNRAIRLSKMMRTGRDEYQ